MSESRKYEVTIAGSADGGGRVPDLSPQEAADRWLNKLRVDKAESTVSSYHYRLKHFIEWCEDEEIDSIGAVNGWDLESFETHRRQHNPAAVTLAHELGTLQNFLEYCARIELVDESLPKKVDPPKVPKGSAVDETMLHPEDAEALLEYYRSTPGGRGTRAHALLELAWFTGARLGALRGLDLEDYNADEQYVAFYHRADEDTPLKNGEGGERIVGILDAVCDALDTYVETDRHTIFDDYGREPLFASQVGRPTPNTVRSWMYLATVPCLHSLCPHGNDPDTCDYLDYTTASQCPSSRAPHQVRTGSITWQRNRGIPADVVAKRVNSSVRVIEEHYDKPDPVEEMEKRRRSYVDRLDFEENGGAGE